jgi:hypothetical protein
MEVAPRPQPVSVEIDDCNAAWLNAEGRVTRSAAVRPSAAVLAARQFRGSTYPAVSSSWAAFSFAQSEVN